MNDECILESNVYYSVHNQIQNKESPDCGPDEDSNNGNMYRVVHRDQTVDVT